MAVYDGRAVAVDEYLVGSAQASLQVCVYAAFGEYGVFAQHELHLARLASGAQRVHILVAVLEVSYHVVVVLRLLHTHDCRTAAVHVVGNLLHSLAVGIVEEEHIVRHHLYCVLRRGMRHVERRVYPDGDVARHEAEYGHDHEAALHHEKHHEERCVHNQRHGKGKPHIRHYWVLLGIQPVAEARYKHNDDGGDIRPHHHLQCEFLYLVQHLSCCCPYSLLLSKSFFFSSADRLSYPLLRILSRMRSTSS